jgi:hypothetical protein
VTDGLTGAGRVGRASQLTLGAFATAVIEAAIEQLDTPATAIGAAASAAAGR